MKLDAQAVETSCATVRPEARTFDFRAADVGIGDEFVVDGGDGILPDEDFLGNQRAEVADDGAHVAVGELEPGAGEGVGEGSSGCDWKRRPIFS